MPESTHDIDCPYWDDDWLWQHPEFPLAESLRRDDHTDSAPHAWMGRDAADSVTSPWVERHLKEAE